MLMQLGPLYREWRGREPRGDCPQCGGECDGEDCGLHAAGCFYGGPTVGTSYWTYSPSCPLYHGESEV